jgi:aldehyde dehydrogenase (NAD+)
MAGGTAAIGPSGMSVLEQRSTLPLPAGLLHIDGRWREASDGGTWTHVHPATNESVATFAVATAPDVDEAVRAARRAFDDGPWGRMAARDRKRILQRIVDLVGDDEQGLHGIQALDNGIPVTFATNVYQLSARIAGDLFDYHAGWTDKLAGETLPRYTGADVFAMTVREPVGVVGAILPWNAPLILFAAKVAPALAAGCTVVLKASEYASLSVLRLTELCEQAGLPPGVLNVVTGPGPTTGEALITHPGVDKLTFTGSRATGSRVMHAAADGVRRVSLELGGKSPNIVFPDVANLDLVAAQVMGMVAMGPSGQGCVCHTRALVHADIYDDLVARCAAMAHLARQGDPFDPGTTAAPIINTRQLDRVMGLIATAQEQGARLVVGGDRPDGTLAGGNWVNPTLFADVDNSATIAQEEVFGPVLAMVPFTDEDDAIRLANDTRYGLGASVHTTDVRRAIRVARAVRAGTFGVNGYTLMPNMPFGGFKESGIGREGGAAGIEEYTELKTILVGIDEVIV